MCGRSVFTAVDTYAAGSSMTRQQIEVRGANGERSHVELRNLRDPHTGKTLSHVESWLCHHTSRATFVELVYVCDGDDDDAEIRRYCHGKAAFEWTRYIDLSGRPLDSGYAIEDPHYDTLDQRLGFVFPPDGETMMPAE